MDNKWREIWNRRKPGTGKLSGNWEDTFLELKRLNGYDVMGKASHWMPSSTNTHKRKNCSASPMIPASLRSAAGQVQTSI